MPSSRNCLGRNGYNEAKCSHFIDALYECCDAFYRKYGDSATSASCPKASLLRLKMKQRRGERDE
ncbi:Cx9C motif-containing protein 4, mitochondrial [Parahypoxylon ruwenzoriense]